MNTYLYNVALFSCLLMLLRVPALHAQAQRGSSPMGGITPEAERRYKAAVKLIQFGDYERGKAELQPIMQRGNSLSPFAYYHHATASFRQRNFLATRQTLKQLLDLFPDWRRRDDASYLLAAAAFESGQVTEATAALQTVSDVDLKPDVTALERSFYGRIQDLAVLKGLHREYPDNRNLALALVNRIQETSTDKNDLELSDRLTNRFGVTTVQNTRPVVAPVETASSQTTAPVRTMPARNRNKGYYNVAVLFPFRIEEFSSDRRARANQYVYDLFEGMKIAKSKLQSEGITVNLFAYDIDNDDDKTLSLLNNPAFAQSDLIFGPLYSEPNRLVTSFAGQNNMLLINPIATSSELVTGQPQAFLAQPSVNQQAQKTLEFVRELGTARQVAIYFGTARRDSILASAYQTLLKSNSYQVVEFRKVSGSAESMASTIQVSELNRPGHVFFASSNEDDGPRLSDALARRHIAAPLVATATAFDFYSNSGSVFTRRELYLLYPDYIDMSRAVVTNFQENYLSMSNIIPSTFASQGYDMLLFFGRQVARNSSLSATSSPGGTPILGNRAALRTEAENDYLLSGFDYTRTNENQIVPIVKYTGGRFMKVN